MYTHNVSQTIMRVIKRNGDYEEVSFDKVLTRLKNLSNNLNFQLISDEEIIEANESIDMNEFMSLEGYLQQQIVKCLGVLQD